MRQFNSLETANNGIRGKLYYIYFQPFDLERLLDYDFAPSKHQFDQSYLKRYYAND